MPVFYSFALLKTFPHSTKSASKIYVLLQF